MLNPVQVGIDVGISGAVAVLDPKTRRVEFYDTPTLAIKVGKKIKNTMDLYAIVTLLQGISVGRDVMVTVERVNAMPGTGAGGERQPMGATSAFNFGRGFGQWEGMLAALRLPTQQVHPRTWKGLVMAGETKDKDASRQKAMQLYPESAPDLLRKKDHGRAEALLIAHWALRTYSPGKMEKLEADAVFALTAEEEPF